MGEKLTSLMQLEYRNAELQEEAEYSLAGSRLHDQLKAKEHEIIALEV